MRTLLRILPVLIAVAIVSDADALRHNQRSDWYFGIGYGMGRGAIDAKGIGTEDYRDGAVPGMRFGRMFGQHFSVGAYWSDWLIEFGVDTLKVRRTLQDLSVGITWYPGNPETATGGVFLRAGAGMGWASTGVKSAAEGEKQEKGERLDEWGIGIFGETGYEFWVTRDVTAGLAFTYHYYSIDADFVQTAEFFATVMQVNLYF